jgi:ribosomal protein S18 acetylase RimI-like enzyme
MSEITIRPVREDELGAVLKLWIEAQVTPPSVTDSLAGLSRLTRTPGALLRVAVIDDRIVASVIGGFDGWRGNIYRLAVAPSWRRRNLARRMVAAIGDALFEMGAERLSALVEHEHPWAIGFWDSLGDLGYRRDPQFIRYIVDRPAPALRPAP